MATIEIFPKVIGKYTLEKEKHSQLKQECFSILSELSEYDESNVENSKLHHFLNKQNQNLFNYSQFEWFEKWLEEKCIDYIENTLGFYLQDGVVITDCWINKCDVGGEQFHHTHTNAYVSGTYYVNYIKGLHAPIGFKNKDFNPENCVMQSIDIPVKFPTKYNSWGAFVNYDEGDLLLWQSNLAHGYSDNKEDNRISISFNVMPRYIYNQSYSFRIERE